MVQGQPGGQRGGTRALLTLVVVMGVMIVAGVAVLGITIVRRLGGAAPMQAAVVLDEPVGTRIQTIAPAGDRLALLLSGGGPDRIVLIDPRTALVTGHFGLPR